MCRVWRFHLQPESKEPSACSPRPRWRSSRISPGASARASTSFSRAAARVQERYNKGERPDFLAETADVRRGDWKVGSIPADLQDRRVEITGPVDRKMIINALNSGATVFMADFEDATSPTWANLVSGQANLHRRRAADHLATRTPTPASTTRSIRETRDADGPPARLASARATLHRRRPARRRACCSTSACSSSTTPRRSPAAGTGPYFYLPKMESHLEARLWNDVFVLAQTRAGDPGGTIKATVLIETLPAAFEMDEILYELREHSPGSTAAAGTTSSASSRRCGTIRAFVLPDRGQVTMEAPFLRGVRAAPDQDLPPPRRLRDGRHGRADPDQGRSRGERARDGQGARRQAARGARRARRHLGRASRRWSRSPSRSSTRTCRARTSSIGCATTCRVSAGRAARAARRALAPKPASATTSASASSTSRRGCGGQGACRSTT